MPPKTTKSLLGWNCSACTFYHRVPAPRCVLCGEMRNATRQEMRDFVLGKSIPNKKEGNVVEIASTPDEEGSKTIPTRAAEALPSKEGKENMDQHSFFAERKSAATKQQPQAERVDAHASSTTNPTNMQPLHPPPPQRQTPAVTAITISNAHLNGKIAPNKNQTLFRPLINVPTRKKHSDKPIVAQPYAPGPVLCNPETIGTWIYPQSDEYPTREYQLQITETALNYNTLVSLPTGLGKTLIAAVVLYNYYRWFPEGKVLFLAPTLPLVHQQVEACYNIMGLPAVDTAILTGRINGQQRLEWWMTRRVFYATPQTVQRDLVGTGPPLFAKQIVCVVLDEAHKASGDYAYTKVIDLLEASGAKFRIVGLSATPGTSIKAINQVVQALRSVKVEARTEEDDSVKQYLHNKETEVIIVKKNTSQIEAEREIGRILTPIMERLRREGGSRLSGYSTVSSYQLFLAKDELQKRGKMNGALFGFFHAASKLIEIRNDARHSLGIVKTKMLRLQAQPQKGILSTIVKGDEFKALLQMVVDATTPNSQASIRNNPKLTKLTELLGEHFRRAKACEKSSRAIVFSQFRDSVSEIVDVLKEFTPMIRPRHFVGQGKPPKGDTGKRLAGMKQSEQQQAIKLFRENHFNVLVCTCIGEEGLDIGEVDLIVNYDTQRSPIRSIQRNGRTGRKRDGRVVCLLTEGEEESKYKKSKQDQKTLFRALRSKKNFIMSAHQPLFASSPKCKFQKIHVGTKLQLSQVVGAAPRRTVSSQLKWKLDLAQEEERQGFLGQIDGLGDIPWRTLRRVFLRAQSTRAHGSRTMQMLEGLKKLGPITSGCKRQRGNEQILNIFPLKAGRKDCRYIRDIRQNGLLALQSKETLDKGVKTMLAPVTMTACRSAEGQFDQTSGFEQKEGVLSNASTDTSTQKSFVQKDITAVKQAKPYSPVMASAVVSGTNDPPSENRGVARCGIYDMEAPLAKLPTEPTAPVATNHSTCSDPTGSQISTNTDHHFSNFETMKGKMIGLTSEVPSTETVFRLPPPPPSSSSSSEEGESDEEILTAKVVLPHPPPLHLDELLENKSEMQETSCDRAKLPRQVYPKTEVSFRLPTQNSSSSEDEISSDEETVTQATAKIKNSINEELNGATGKDEIIEDDVPLISLKSPKERRKRQKVIAASLPALSTGPVKDGTIPPLSIMNPKQQKILLTSHEDVEAVSEEPKHHESLRTKGKLTSGSCSSFDTPNPVRSKALMTDRAEAGNDPEESVSHSQQLLTEPGQDEDVPLISLRNPKQRKKHCKSRRALEELQGDRRRQILESSENVEANIDMDSACLRTNSQDEKTQMSLESVTSPQIVLRMTEKKRKCILSDDVSQGNLSTSNLEVDLTPGTTPSHQYSDACGSGVLLDTPSSLVQQRANLGDEASTREEYEMALTNTPSLDTAERISCVATDSRSVDPDEIICSVCFSRDSLDDDPIVLCDGCNLGFHQLCYSIKVDLNTDKSWFCDLCKNHSLPGKVAQERCGYCSKQNRPMKKLPKVGWCHPLCHQLASESTGRICAACSKSGAVKCFSCSESAHPYCAANNSSIGLWTIVRIAPSIEGTQKNGALFCPSHANDANSYIYNYSKACEVSGGIQKIKVIQSRKETKFKQNKGPKRLRKRAHPGLAAKERSPKADVFDGDKSIDDADVEKAKRLKRRRQVMSRFILEEAAVGSDDDGDGDESETLLRQVDEDELSHDSFINDSTHLTQHFSQDILAGVDPDVSIDIDFQHRALDAERDRENQFKTPVLNRQMKRIDDSQLSSTSSQRGLGNMHFIRSVLEHHRQGGRAEEIEGLYHKVAQEESREVIESPPMPGQMNTPKKALSYVSRCEDGDNLSGSQKTPLKENDLINSLTAEQRLQIEKNRLEALRRRRQLGAGKIV